MNPENGWSQIEYFAEIGEIAGKSFGIDYFGRLIGDAVILYLNDEGALEQITNVRSFAQIFDDGKPIFIRLFESQNDATIVKEM